MNVYEYAMKLEKEGESYYRDLAKGSPFESLKKVFEILANEEVKHYILFKNMFEDNELETFNLELDVKAILSILSEEKKKKKLDPSALEFYKKLIAAESDLAQFYLNKAEEIEDKVKKEVVIKISKEEAKHKIVLQNILDFIQSHNNFAQEAAK